METRTAHFRTAFHLLCWRKRTSRSPGQGEIKSRRIVRSGKIQRSSDLFRQSAREICSRANGVVGLQGERSALGSSRRADPARSFRQLVEKRSRVHVALRFVPSAFGAWKLPCLGL